MNSFPIITIVTSTYNAANLLPYTADSIRKQTYKNVQWVIVDGASTDGTLDFIKSNSDIIDTWISEPDSGIYDAWNKAIPFAKGEWIQFLGAGDELASPITLEETAEYLGAERNSKLVYGRLLLIDENNRNPIREIGESWDKIKDDWFFFRPRLPMHPEIFHHISLFNNPPYFDVSLKIAADSLFLLNAIKTTTPIYIPVLIDKMIEGGVSSRPENGFKVAREVWDINRRLGIRPPLLHTIQQALKLISKYVMVKTLPSKWYAFIKNWFANK